jgi:hypothetical protein
LHFTRDGTAYYLNGSAPDATQALYQALQAAMK